MGIIHALGQAVRHFRKGAGLRQQDFGDDNSSMSRFERGEQGMSIERFYDVAGRIGVAPSSIWRRAEEDLARGSKRKSVDLRLTAAKEQSAWLAAVALFVESVIETTPAAIPSLRSVLSKMLLTRASDEERELAQRLIVRLDEAGRLAKSSAPRAHASSR